MNKNKTIILLVIGILVVTISSIGITYSFMLPKAEKENNRTEIGINNCAKITLKDNDSTINLENMYPMEEEVGLKTNPYEFTISSTCEEYTGFNLYLLTYEENEISDNLIRYGITSKNDTLLETNLITKEEAKDITEEEIKEINQGINKGYNKIYKVYSNNIPLKGESEYKLHIWLDEKANNDTMNKNIKLGVIVKGYSRDETLTEYIIKNKNDTLLYHNGTILDDNGNVIDAEDYSYRYTGASEDVNNYVCFGSDNCKDSDEYLYRIIGLFDDDQDGIYNVKIIKNESIGVKEWNDLGNNQWDKSSLKNYLNEVFYNTLNKKSHELIDNNHKWEIRGSSNGADEVHIFYKHEMGLIKESSLIYPADTPTIYANVGLMYASDYGFATNKNYWKIGMYYYDSSEVRDFDWLYLGKNEWTLSRHSNNSTAALFIVRSGYLGGIGSGGIVTSNYEVRPVMYLKSNIKKTSNSGDGTLENPYQISL